jgi:hypothetical protein
MYYREGPGIFALSKQYLLVLMSHNDRYKIGHGEWKLWPKWAVDRSGGLCSNTAPRASASWAAHQAHTGTPYTLASRAACSNRRPS